MKKLRLSLLKHILFFAVLIGGAVPPKPAMAGPWCCMVCPMMCCNPGATNGFITQAFNNYRNNFIMNSFYRNQFKQQGLKPMADDIRAAAVGAGMMIGAFLDGSAVNMAQATMQSLNAETIKDFHVSDQICRFGTLSKSLARSESMLETQQAVFSARAMARNAGREFSSGAAGRGRDNYERLKNFVSYYCDNSDNDMGLSGLCIPVGNATETRNIEYNRDIDYTRAMEESPTLNIDVTDNVLTRDENTVFNLFSYLYGHTQDSSRLSGTSISEFSGSIEKYVESRSVIARRAVAQNSFSKMMAMRSSGSGASHGFMNLFLIRQLGLPSQEADKYTTAWNPGPKVAGYDDSKKPSYYAQMDILAKRIYQDPEFYVNLMDTKANVKRISASMEAIDLAQTRDMYEAVSRSEMLMALLLDMEARKQVDENYGKFSEVRQ